MQKITDTENRDHWYRYGEYLEGKFVTFCNSKTDLITEINPQKTIDKTVPDLIVNGRLSDLKTQNTPFFTASRYGIDPQYAVTFNRKDYERYSKLYPDLDIYFWIEWQNISYNGLTVKPMRGIYYANFQFLKPILESAPEHTYLRRQGDERRNALSSFVIDIRTLYPVMHIM